MFTHSFGFDTYLDSKIVADAGVDVLDYRYGDSGQFGTHASAERVARGEAFHRWQMSGKMPPGESLYVRWRVNATQEVFEETVDLKGTLPRDLTGYDIHFTIDGPKLFVFLIPPPTGWDPRALQFDQTFRSKHQIYPRIAM